MTQHVKPVTSSPASTRVDAAEPESLAQLRSDCARMAPHWTTARHPAPGHGSAADLHGVTVPTRSAELLDGMSEYGD